MRILMTFFTGLFFACLGSAVGAAELPKDKIVEQPDSPAAPKRAIDQLYDALKRERDPDKAASIAAQIRTQLSDPGSPTIALLLQWADKAAEEKRIPAAFDFLDQAIALKPDYAGSWNSRATLNFTLGSYRRSMADIEQVLRIEPRHLGALSGMAALLEASDEDGRALEVLQRYLDLYPSDRAAQEKATELAEKLAGSPT